MINEEFIDVLIEHIKSMDDKERSMLCEELIIQCMIWGSFNGFEAIGMAEAAKKEYMERLDAVFSDDDDEDDYEDGDEWKRLLKNK